MELNFNNKKLEIWMRDSKRSIYAFTVKDHRLAKKINLILRHYPIDTVFKKGEEALMILDAAQLKRVGLEVLFIGKILKQVGQC